MAVIIYNNDEGGISIVRPTGSVQDALKDVPSGKPYKIVEDNEIPQDREFRGAWTYDLEIDIEKAKEIKKNKIRQERKPLLEALDVEFMRAIENGDTVKQEEIKLEKQRLRDITTQINSIETIDELKGFKI